MMHIIRKSATTCSRMDSLDYPSKYNKNKKMKLTDGIATEHERQV